MNAAIRALAKSLRYNVEQAKADLARMQVRTRDQFFHQGYQNGRIAVMESVAESLDVLDDHHQIAGAVIVDLDDWARAPEMIEYARRRGIPPPQAIRELVNTGLSYQRGRPLTDTEERDRATNGGAGYPVG